MYFKLYWNNDECDGGVIKTNAASNDIYNAIEQAQKHEDYCTDDVYTILEEKGFECEVVCIEDFDF